MEATCSCGSVVLEVTGSPIVSLVCYCDTCQEGSKRIESLPNAPSVRDPDGGTGYVSYRKDRVTYSKGRELLDGMKLEPESKTSRVIATCCNSAMLMRFDDARHWVPVYRARLGPNAPAIQMRICTSAMPVNADISTDVPSYPEYSPSLMLKLLSSAIAMRLRL
jgi:hypothetical protein